MKIDAIDVYHVAFPLKRPLPVRGAKLDRLESVLVRFRSGDAFGWGEAAPGTAPFFGGEFAAGAFAAIRDWFAPRIVGTVVDSGQHLEQRLATFRGNSFAKGALDIAWWDLRARQQGQPLWKTLGGTREAIEVGPVIDQMESVEGFFDVIRQAMDAGFARVKLMFRPGWDVHMADAVRKEFPVYPFHVDVEGELTLGHMDMLCRLDDFDLAMVEQPLSPDDLVGHAMVQEAVRTPICLDESITCVSQAEMALELKSCRYINLKPDRVGGLTAAVAIHDAAAAESIPCWVGAMPQTGLGTRVGLALASKKNCTYPADWLPLDDYADADLFEPLVPTRGEDGTMRVALGAEAGLGFAPDEAKLQHVTIARATFPA
ncbi:MAG: o-succinylbenzoate synthase [Patescibacteria group bacterium]|nr:o-succinylbenzoate synthase [Patescibacteria group bacterium]